MREIEDFEKIKDLEKRLQSLDKISTAVGINYKEPGLLETDLKKYDALFKKSKITPDESKEFENIKMRLQPIRDVLYSGMPQTDYSSIYYDIKNISQQGADIKQRLRELKKTRAKYTLSN